MEQIDWTVRYAARDDLARVNELRAMVSALHAAGRPDIFRPGFCEALAARAAQALDAPKEGIVVACAGAQVCGFALVQYVDRPESAYQHARRIYHIEEFGVDADYRRRGAATAMIEFRASSWTSGHSTRTRSGSTSPRASGRTGAFWSCRYDTA